MIDLATLPARTREFCEHGAPEGERQQSAFDAACQLRDVGATEAEARVLVEAGAGRCGLELDKARSAVKSAFSRSPREPIHKGNGKTSGAAKKIVAVYDYANERGVVLFQCVRYSPKDFRQRQPDGRGDFVWNLKGVKLVLYRLPEVVKASEVWIVEGERDADSLAALGFCATCNPMGAGKWRAEYSEALRGKRVVIIPDNDKPGQEHAEQVAKALHGIAASVRVVRLPEGVKDVSDFILTFDHKAKAGERLSKLAEGAAEWQPTPSAADSVDDWPEPSPLPEDLPSVPAFNFGCLPDTLRPWLLDIAERMQCPPDFPAVAATVALGSLVGRKIGIRPKRYDDWLVVPNIWGAIVGRPGLMKSPAAEQALLPLRRLIAEASKRYEMESGEHKITALLKAQRVKLHERKIAEHLKDGDEASARAEAKASTSADDSEPKLRRYEVNDSTVAKLGELLTENPNGLLVHRDELIGFLRGLDKEGAEESRAFYLESWNGTGSFVFDRIGRGTVRVESNTLAILGGIQPDLLTSYVREAVRGGMGADGLLQRFQLAVWPDIARDWRNVDRWPDTAAKNEAFNVFKYLDGLDPAEIGADGSSGIPFLRFDSAAQDCFDQWRARLEAKLRDDSEHPAFEAHLSKYRKLVPALALLIHLADRGAGNVPLSALEKALLWACYLEKHARRIYSAVLRPDTAAARELAKHLQRSELAARFNLREVYRRGWAGLSSKDDAEAATEILSDLGWIRPAAEDSDRKGGRPASQAFEVNPKTRHTPTSELTELTKGGSVSFVSDHRGVSQDFPTTSGNVEKTPSPSLTELTKAELMPAATQTKGDDAYAEL